MIGNPLLRKDDLLQKKLWLKIAEYLIMKEKDISKYIYRSYQFSFDSIFLIQSNAVLEGV